MPLLKYINQFVYLFEETLSQFFRWRIWLVLVVYALIAWLVLYIHYNISSTLFFSIMKVWTALVASGQAAGFFHYPGHFALMPQYFEWAKLILSILLEGLFLGTAAMLFRNIYRGTKQDLTGTFKKQLRLWGQLILALVVFNAVFTLVGWVLPTLFAPLIRGYGRRTLMFAFVLMPLVYSIILALFYFAIPSIALGGLNFLKGIGRSLTIFGRRSFTCFFLSVIILSVPVVVAAATQQSDYLIEKFHPEIVYWLLVLGLIVDMVAAFLWMGTAARFLASEES